MDALCRYRPRRSLLFVPGSHVRALEKARRLSADVLILDLEDGVAPAVKQEARRRICALLAKRPFGHREVVVRINRLDTREGLEDLTAVAQAGVEHLMLPKVEGAGQVEQAVSMARQLGAAHRLRVWANVETPKGFLHAGEIAAEEDCFALVAGTNDLRACLRLPHTDDRMALLHALSHLVLAARAHDRYVFDGTYIRFDDEAGLKRECEEGRRLGFDGKTLVHPSQIDAANAVYSPTQEEVTRARQVIEQYDGILEAQRSVGVLDGVMVEALHVHQALRTLRQAEMIEKIQRLAA